MTTAPSLLHSAMEIPTGEDLEMASPYQGQTDDFDIDIDLMEDHASNMDSDMMGADDFPNTSQPSLFQNEATDDDDMVDEPSEGSMVDAEDLPDGDNDVDVHFEEVTYEADMLEGGNDEPVDAVLPTVFIEAPTTTEPQINEPTQIAPETTEPIEKEQDTHEVAPPSILEGDKQGPTNQEQPISLEASDVGVGQAEEVQPLEIPQPSLDHDQNKETNEQTKEAIENENGNENIVSEGQDTSNQLVGSLEAPASPSAQAEALGTEPHESHAPREPEPQTHEDVHEDETLHPVKVIYQENEISLFPPLEGDSAETFFLHDEDIAYDNFDKLFESLRDVLLDNIAEHDVLVIDIDSLGIQITEDSSYTSRFTLHQIMDIYLRLSHNDGNNHPDALYLSLSSKQAVHTELASLDSAAKEGKGLSQIQLWADYDDAEEEPAAEDTGNDGDGGEGLHSQATQQSQSAHEEASTSSEVPDGTNDSNEAANLPAEGTQEPIVEQHAEIAGPQPELEITEAHESFQEIPNDDVAYTEVHDNSEDSRKAPINTVAPDSESAAITEQPEDKSAADIPHDASEEHTTHQADQENEHDELDDSDELSGADDLEVVDFSIHEDEYDEQNEAETVDFDHEDVSSNQEAAEEAHDDDDPDAAEANIESNLYEESESTLDNAPQGDLSHQQTPEPEDDLLGIADDVLRTPKDEEKHEDELVDLDFEDGADDIDYHHDPELDVTEGLELGEIDPSTDSHNDNLSVKRSREEEDEWDITESTTPDLKRRRPS
ncbi:hypothetical protein N7456_012330 [Penicillium angulare]|uniref:Uncharacterized protein n=1 Tax=Penicillium angulare TaxID=116970 RepID=A0A9W9EVK9_9EURO|nr:hypothetical protein N7456_012330 [Penicillium angulare]